MVAGHAGGIPLQMADGVGGLLVDSVPACANALVELLTDPARSAALAAAGRERVRRHFLLPRLVFDELALLDGLAHGDRPGALLSRADHRDPVCGMSTHITDPGLSIVHNGQTYRFCSQQCRRAFTDTLR